MLGMSMDIGVDLGTANVLVYIKGKGVVLNEPSVVAIDKDSDRVLAIGEEARRMIGRTPGNIVAIRPLREGVIADYDTTESMLRHFIEKVAGKSFLFKPRIMVCIPSGVTTVEKRAVLEAAVQAGARKTYLIEEPLAAALGAGLEISEPYGAMVVDIGGGTTDVAVISLGGIVISDSLRIGGDKFDEAIIRYVKNEYNIMIGERTAYFRPHRQPCRTFRRLMRKPLRRMFRCRSKRSARRPVNCRPAAQERLRPPCRHPEAPPVRMRPCPRRTAAAQKAEPQGPLRSFFSSCTILVFL